MSSVNRHTVLLLLKPEASLWLSLVDGCALCVWFVRYGKFEAGNKLSYTEFQVPPTHQLPMQAGGGGRKCSPANRSFRQAPCNQGGRANG